MTRSAFITGVSGLSLTADETAFIAEARPWGLILFARNIANPAQVSRLIAEFRAALGDAAAPVLIDQEGGRVQRLRQPHWADYPAARVIGELYAEDRKAGVEAAYLKALLIGDDLAHLGITIDCAPALDLGFPGAHPVIGERAFSADPQIVATLAAEAMHGFTEAGILPVIKHMPGHGRSLADTHFDLPVIATPLGELEATDFAPFKALNTAAFGMTAHIIYAAIDPETPATLSEKVVTGIIREAIGFHGALMSDDLGMKALPGDFREKTERTLAAGVDLALHCSGVMNEMRAVAEGAAPLTGESLTRCAKALAARQPPTPFDRFEAEARLSALLRRIGAGDRFRPAEGLVGEGV